VSSTVDEWGANDTRENATRLDKASMRAASRRSVVAPRRSRVEGERGVTRRGRHATRGDDAWTDDANDDADFAPRVDARAAVTSLVVGAAFFIVNRRVAGAVEARRRREALEEERREISLRRLSGSASSDDLDAVDEALESALRREASAREMFGGVVRVRMPQPLGKPLREVEEEEKRAAGRAGRGETNAGGEEEEATPPPWWMTTVSAVVLVLLTWSAVGLGSVDRVANAPDLTPEELERFRAGG
jgi:hypothetical protein